MTVGDHRTSGNGHTRLSEPSPAPAKGLGEELTISRTAPFFSFSHIDPFWKLFRNWCACVHAMRGQTGELLEPMARVARMVEGHLEGILAHWTRGLTTAFMEGLNSLFSAVKRKARGYRTVEYMTAMLYFVAGKLTLPCY